MRPVKFGDAAGQTYTFGVVTELTDNFGDPVTQSIRLPGLDGAFDPYLGDPAPNAMGNVRVGLVLKGASRADIDDARDALRATQRWGLQKLYITDERASAKERWTWAKTSNVRINGDLSRAGLFVAANMEFQAMAPFWIEDGTPAITPPTGTHWTQSAQLSASGTSTSWSLDTGGGNAYTPVYLRVTAVGGGVSDFRITRRVGGTVVDQVDYDGAVGAGEDLDINGEGLTVAVNGSDAYGSDFSVATPWWLRLEPGVNDLDVVLGSGETATVTAWWHRRFR